MKRKIKISGFIILIAYITFVFFIPTATAGLGISPSSITVENALKGGTFEKTIVIYNSAEDPGDFIMSAEGDLKDWFSFHEVGQTENLTSITIPEKGSKNVLIKITIPEDTPNGIYNDTIYVQSSPPKETDTGGMVAQAVIRVGTRLSIEVTGTQILAGNVRSIAGQDTEVGYPFRINVVFKNTGNVLAQPKIDVKIMDKSSQIEHITRDDFGVKVESTDTIPVEWITTGQDVGNYTANVTVSLGDDLLGEKSLSFKILPYGTLTRQGNLITLSTDSEPLIGRTIKILANFKNTGKIDTKAKFIGEVYVDGNLIDTVNSEELLVPVYEASTLTTYLKIEAPGNYVVKGHALYDGKTTDTKELSFDVEKNGSLGLSTGISSLIAIALVFLWRRKY